MENSQPNPGFQQPMFYNQPIPSQSAGSNMSLMKICQFNCVCCMNMQNGKGQCSCGRVQHTVGTQTDVMDLMTPDLDTSFWKRGTIPHNLLQDCIKKTVAKYNISKKSDGIFDSAVKEVMAAFPDMKFIARNQERVAQRISRVIRWDRFQSNKKRGVTKEKNTTKDQDQRSEAEGLDNETMAVAVEVHRDNQE